MTRKEAIKTLKGEAWICCAEKWNEALAMAIKALEQESKTGHWIPVGYDDYGDVSSYKCSECGERSTYHDNFCSNCGAKMGEISDETDN